MENKGSKIKSNLLFASIFGCLVAVIFSALGFAVLDRINQKQAVLGELSHLSVLVATDIAAAQEQADYDQVQKKLETIEYVQDFVFACAYDLHGNVVAASFNSDPAVAACPTSASTTNYRVFANDLDHWQMIEAHGEQIGSLVIRRNTAEFNQQLLGQIPVMLFIIGCSVALGLVVSFGMYRKVVTPILDLSGLANKITEHNNYSIRAVVNSADEVGAIASAFNELLGKIEEDKEELTRLAYYDPLTKLANRRMFGERLVFALENARRCSEHMGVIVIDLDQFKDINDDLGHDIGDLLLKSAAKRLESVLPANATAFRLGGDEFTVLQVAANADQLEAVAEAVLRAFAEPLILAGRQVSISSSIGIAISDGNDNVSTIMKRADLALHQAKDSTNRRYTISNIHLV